MFSGNVYSMNYRFKLPDPALSAKILSLTFHGASNRGIARSLEISEHCVRIRLQRLAKRALEFQSKVLENFKITEPLCYDGLQNFAGSQYDPNNINQILGRDSLFIYDYNFAPLNRTGRMSEWQKTHLKYLIRNEGRYNGRAIRLATTSLLRRVHAKCDKNKMTLFSDEHYQYRRSIKHDLKDLCIDHITISSKACRNFQNILFAVNHADLVIRQRVAAFTRETISFSKTAGSMCQRYALFMVHKNFMLPQFTKKHVRRPLAHQQSPAQAAKIVDKILEYSDIFAARSIRLEKMLNSEWQHFYYGKIPSEYLRNKKHRTHS